VTVRVVIIGAGAVGLSCAYFVARRGAEVVVLERGLPGAQSSTRTGGGVRTQFDTSTNIQLSLLSEDFWRNLPQLSGHDPRLNSLGYLFLGRTAADLAAIEDRVALQNAHGVSSEVLMPGEVRRRWPFFRDQDISGASFCAADGYLNHHIAIAALATSAREAGAQIRSGIEALGFETRGHRIRGVRTTHGTVPTDLVVNAAGAWASEVAAWLNIDVPVQGRRHELLVVDWTEDHAPDLPWMIDPLGVHLRPDDGNRALIGGFLGIDEAVDPNDFQTDYDRDWAHNVLHAVHEQFGVHFRTTDIVRGWAGLYPSTPDHHPIIDQIGDLVVVGGFSGTGLMHAPAAGILAAELIFDGQLLSAPANHLALNRDWNATERSGF
jgi:sarcosine oxidase subunit beta